MGGRALGISSSVTVPALCKAVVLGERGLDSSPLLAGRPATGLPGTCEKALEPLSKSALKSDWESERSVPRRRPCPGDKGTSVGAPVEGERGGLPPNGEAGRMIGSGGPATFIWRELLLRCEAESAAMLGGIPVIATVEEGEAGLRGESGTGALASALKLFVGAGLTIVDTGLTMCSAVVRRMAAATACGLSGGNSCLPPPAVLKGAARRPLPGPIWRRGGKVRRDRPFRSSSSANGLPMLPALEGETGISGGGSMKTLLLWRWPTWTSVGELLGDRMIDLRTACVTP